MAGGAVPTAGTAAGASRDPRVDAVLAVLAGTPLPMVAEDRHLDVAVLERWVEAFVAAGTARVTNRPQPETALERDRFLAAFAHELRTPLTVVSGWADLVRPAEDSPGGQAALGHLRRGLDRLTERLVDLELLGAAAMGRLELEPRPVRLAELLEDLEVGEVGGDGGDVELLVDQAHFRRVLRDLWDASGVQPAPPARALAVEDLGSWVQVSVVRQGAPLSHDTLRAMFDPFEHDMDATGVAVGLYLARALTVAHSGTLGVSQDEQRTVFWVRVPSPSRTNQNPQEDLP